MTKRVRRAKEIVKKTNFKTAEKSDWKRKKSKKRYDSRETK